MLTAAELADMSDVAEESMMDTCTIRTFVTTYDAVGGAIQTATDGALTPCGLKFVFERAQESIEVAGVRYDVNAIIRLALSVTVAPQNQIRVTKRYGMTLMTPLLFEVLGVTRVGPTAQQAMVRLLQ